MAFSWDAQSLRAAIDDPGLSFAALQVANQGSGRHELTGAEAVAFFTGSGLPQEALSQIWMTSTKGAPEMGPQMFLEALKLAYDALHGGQSSSQMAPPAPPSASSFGAPPSGPTPEERQKYSAHYGTLPGANSQQVSLPDAAEFLSKAKIKRELIEQILVKNTRGSGAVTLDAFVQSMHETYEARKAKKEKKGMKSAAKAAMASGAFGSTLKSQPSGSASWRSAPPPPPLEQPAANTAVQPGQSVSTSSAFASFDAPPGQAPGGMGGGAFDVQEGNSGGFASFDSDFGASSSGPAPVGIATNSGGGFASFDANFGAAASNADMFTEPGAGTGGGDAFGRSGSFAGTAGFTGDSQSQFASAGPTGGSLAAGSGAGSAALDEDMFSGAQYGSPPKAGALGFDLGGGGFGGEIQPEIQTEIQPAPEMQASGFGGFGGDQSLAAFEAPPLTAVEPPALSVQAPAEPSAATGDMFSSFDAPNPNPPHPAPGGDAFASFEAPPAPPAATTTTTTSDNNDAFTSFDAAQKPPLPPPAPAPRRSS